jgi:hypothetical protein
VKTKLVCPPVWAALDERGVVVGSVSQEPKAAQRLFSSDVTLVDSFAMTDHIDGVPNEELPSHRGVPIANTVHSSSRLFILLRGTGGSREVLGWLASGVNTAEFRSRRLVRRLKMPRSLS